MPENEEQKNRRPPLTFYSDEFVFNTQSGMFYRLSPTAGMLLHALVDGASIEDLTNLLQSKYGITEKNAVRDVELFLNDIETLDVLDRIDTPILRTADKDH